MSDPDVIAFDVPVRRGRDLAAWLVCIVAVAGLLAFAPQVVRGVRIWTWPTVPGQIVARDVRPEPLPEDILDAEKTDVDERRLRVRYSYAVNNQSYIGTYVGYVRPYARDTRSERARLAVGQLVTVHYDAASPSDAVLDVAPPVDAVLWLALSIAGLVWVARRSAGGVVTAFFRRLASVAAGAVLLSCASVATSIAQTARPSDLTGDWQITFVVTKRGEMSDSTRRPTRDSLIARMRLRRLKAPPPDPQYKVRYVWPGWNGDVIAPFTTLLQVPPMSAADLLGPHAPRHKYRSSDSLGVGVWDDSTGIRFAMEAVGCSDCGNIGGSGTWQSGIAAGTWYQEFYGPGDSGRWRMQRIDSTTKEAK
jgi:hypothetical protein